MFLYRISKCKYIEDISGYGASLDGGRWNSAGTYMLYTSQSIALCMLEVLVSLPRHLAKHDFCLLTLEIDDDEIFTLNEKKLPQGWDAYPHINATQITGDEFLNNKRAIGLKVPSAVVPAEYNILLNPRHPGFGKKVKIVSRKTISIDKRLIIDV